MKPYQEMSRSELEAAFEQLENEFEEFCARGLKLDMSRGKPSSEQMDICMGLLDAASSRDHYISANGMDCRNYGALTGIPEAKKLLGDLIGVPEEMMIVMGNASLPIMYDMVAHSVLHGVCGSTPWMKLEGKVKFLCPVPGYDRHFAITEFHGIEMINIPMTPDGPDMDLVEKYVYEDDMVKGIWCVPQYSNPQGITYSDETVRRFASLKPAAEDFRIYWDNAYAVHHLYDKKNRDSLLNIYEECEKQGNPDLFFEFCSTSKISFAGAGIAGVASSRKNREWIQSYMTIQIISYDKLNQLRHAYYFKNSYGIRLHMKKHADIIRPKFQKVLEILDRELTGLGIGEWTNPKGGYFISFEALEGCARKIVGRCKEAGVTLTSAGATFPYRKDPKDSNIRIAPTYPELDELQEAAELFCLAVKLVSVEKLLGK